LHILWLFLNPNLFSAQHSHISELTGNYYPLDQEQASYPNGSTLIPCFYFLHHCLENLDGQPKYKNISIRIVSRWEHQNHSTFQTGLRATLHDIQGNEGNKEAATITMFLQSN
jgi:hypothetical protein